MGLLYFLKRFSFVFFKIKPYILLSTLTFNYACKICSIHLHYDKKKKSYKRVLKKQEVTLEILNKAISANKKVVRKHLYIRKLQILRSCRPVG